MMEDAIYTIAFVASAAISLTVAVAAWRRRPAPGSLGLALLCIAQFEWSAAFALQWVFTDHGSSAFWFNLRLLGLMATPIAILVLVIDYVGKRAWLKRRNVIAICTVPTMVYLIALTDPLHGLYLGGAAPAIIVNRGGPGFVLNLVYSYALILFAGGLLIIHLMRRPPYPQQAAVLLVAVLLPVVHFSLQFAGITLLPRVNSVPFSFTVSGAIELYALTRLGLFRLVPVARDQLIEQSPTGVVVFDADRRIIDINPAALWMTGASGTSMGKSADEAFPRQIETVLRLREGLLTSDSALTRAEFAPGLHIEATASVLENRAGERVATMVTLRDITKELTAAEEISKQGEQLAAAYERTNRILTAMTEGVMLVDASGTLLHSNPALDDILETVVAREHGRPVDDLIPELAASGLQREAHLSASPVPGTVVAPNGRILEVEVIALSEAAPHEASTLYVIRDATERHAAERMQRDFVANVAHELQTPLTGLSLLARTIPTAMHDDPQAVGGFIERLDVEVDRLVHLTGELLTLSRAEASASAFPQASTDVARIVADEVRAVEQLAASKEQSIEVTAPEGVAAACDPVDLGVLVGNLLRNAVRYSGIRGHIRIIVSDSRSETCAARIEIVVSDDGIGIPADDQERIFERFYRIDKARSRKTGGAGLGLSIVKQIAEKYGGSVSLMSAPGEGSTFTVSLPAAGRR